jgi:sulfate-transporting ATPase
LNAGYVRHLHIQSARRVRALEEALEDFVDCAVIISHDRWFPDRIATHILAFKGDRPIEWFEGNLQGR